MTLVELRALLDTGQVSRTNHFVLSQGGHSWSISSRAGGRDAFLADSLGGGAWGFQAWTMHASFEECIGKLESKRGVEARYSICRIDERSGT